MAKTAVQLSSDIYEWFYDLVQQVINGGPMYAEIAHVLSEAPTVPNTLTELLRTP